MCACVHYQSLRPSEWVSGEESPALRGRRRREPATMQQLVVIATSLTALTR